MRVVAFALGAFGALPAAAQLNYPTTVNTAGTANAANPGFLVTSQTWRSLANMAVYPSGVVNLTNTFPVDLDDDGNPITPNVRNLDDANSPEQTLGFNFPFTGGAFNKVIVNTNGFIKLGNTGMTPPTASVSAGITYSLWNSAAAGDVNLITAFGADLYGAAESTSPVGSYRFFTNADSAVIEWSRVHDFDYGSTAQTQYQEISFQIKLFPSGVVKLAYGPTVGKAASMAMGRIAHAGLKAVSSSQVYRIQKASSTAFWQTAAPVNTVYTATGNAGTASQLNFRQNVLPTQTAASTFLAAGLAREYRLTPTAGATFAADASVLLYSLGQIPKAGGAHIYRARVSNKTNVTIAAGGTARLNVTGANAIGPISVVLPQISVGATVVVNFPAQTFANTGTQTATVTIPADGVAADNTSSFTQDVTGSAYGYGSATIANAGGVGYDGTPPAFVGEFAARFTTATPQTLSQARIDFQAANAATGPVPYQVLVFDDNGTDNNGNPGAPGTLLYASGTLLSPVAASTATIPLLPAGQNGVLLTAGDFFVGVRQVGPNNVSFSYETENPLRDRGFYSRSSLTGNPTNSFADFSTTGSPFRFAIGADLLTSTVPAITGFSPASGAPGTVVTLTGTNLNSTTSVSFNGVAATPTSVTGTSVTVTVPATATTGLISVTTTSGTATSAASFSVLPRITSFSPSAGAAVGATVTLTGSGFTGATAVAFNGVAASSFTVVSATSLTAVVPPAATTGILSVTTAGGTATSATSFKVLPKITSFSPASGAVGTVVTLTGTSFTGATAVRLSTVAATSYTVVNPTTITATVPAGALSGRLSVVTAGGTGTSTAMFYVVPTISSFSPGQGAPGSVVIVTGLNFTSTTKVYFNGLLATTTYNSTTQLTATVPAGATTGKLGATNAYGTGLSATNYTVVSGPAPTITSFTPATGPRGASVVLTGTNFTSVTAVQIGTVAVAAGTGYVVNSPTQITLTVPATAVTGKFFVTAAGGMAQSATSYTVILPPTITSFSPASAAAGTTVTINGTNLTGTSAVTFGGVSATSYTVVSAAKITAVVPTGAASGSVSVTTVAGTASRTGFTYTGPRPAARVLATSVEAGPVQLAIYPNPASSAARLTVQVLNRQPSSTADVYLLDAFGRPMLTTPLDVARGEASFDLTGLAAGMYVVRCGDTARKVLVQ